MITKNMSRLDRTLRFIAGVVLIPVGLLALHGWEGSGIGLAVAVFAVLPIATGLVGFCPLYVPFGISTLREDRTAAGQTAPVEGTEVFSR
jgi:hypothetical protein